MIPNQSFTAMNNVFFAFALCAITISCNQAESVQEQPQTEAIGTIADGVVDTDFVKQMKLDEEKYKPSWLVLENGSYEKMSNFILKKGYRIKDNDVQYTFWDSHGNRHGMVVIQRPNKGHFSEAKPIQISVWVNNPDKGAKPDKEFFFYAIHPGDSLVLEGAVNKAYKEEIMFAIDEFKTKKI